MALYKIALRFSNDNASARRVKWSNVFYRNVDTAVLAANSGITAWTNHLNQAARRSVFCYEVYASSVTEGDSDYVVLAVPPGDQRALGPVPVGAQQYQLNSCLAVNLPVSGSRPSRKFWRPGLFESDVENGTEVITSLVSAIQSSFNSMLAGSAWLDPDGQAVLPAVTVKFTQRKLGRLAGFNLPTVPAQG